MIKAPCVTLTSDLNLLWTRTHLLITGHRRRKRQAVSNTAYHRHNHHFGWIFSRFSCTVLSLFWCLQLLPFTSTKYTWTAHVSWIPTNCWLILYWYQGRAQNGETLISIFVLKIPFFNHKLHENAIELVCSRFIYHDNEFSCFILVVVGDERRVFCCSALVSVQGPCSSFSAWFFPVG